MLWEFTKGSRRRYSAAIAAMIAATMIMYLSPLVIGTTIDSILGDKPLSGPSWYLAALGWLGGKEYLARNLWLAAAALVTLTVASGAANYGKGAWAARASESISRRLRERLYDRLQNLPCGFHDKAETGDLIQRCTSDVETVHLFLSQQVLEIALAAVLLVTVLPMMLALNTTMTWISMLLVGPILGFAMLFFVKVRGAFQVSDEAEGSMTAKLQENLTGIRVVRAFARQEHECDEFARRSRTFRDLDYRLIRTLGWFWSMSDLMCFAQRGMVLLIGAAFVRQGAMTIGTMVAFFAYADKFLWPVRRIGRTLTELGKATVSVGRLREILAHPTETTTPPAAAAREGALARRAEASKAFGPGRIEVRDLKFGHDQAPHVLDGVSFTVEPGETLAILGPSGSGKSTIVNLLLRLYDYREGSIRIDGRELKALDRRAVRSAVGVVLQEPFLYSRSLRDNISLGNSLAGEEEIVAAASAAAVHDSILDFDQGYETLVGERGATLSGGQRQRVALARAMLTDPAVLILDDALSAVDTRTESLILDALQLRRGRRTTILIAHRLSTLRRADRVLVLDRGRVVQSGRHETLLAAEGLYRDLWRIQNSLEEDLSKDMQAV